MGQKIAGDLRFDEEVVRHVLLDGLNDPIAIAEGVFVRVVAFGIQTVVGIAGNVEPEAAPLFAIARRVEESVDDFGESVGRIVAFESGDFCGRGRQTSEIVSRRGGGVRVCWRRDGFEVFFFQLGENEAVDIAARPFFVCDGGRRGIGDRPERPEGALFRSDDVRRGVRRGGGLRCGLRPNGAVLDPGFDVGNFGIFEAAGGRHFEARVVVVQRFDHEAGGGIAGNDDGAGFAAFQRVFGGIELQASHVFLGVAGVTVVDEERADAHFEELFVGRLREDGRNE